MSVNLFKKVEEKKRKEEIKNKMIDIINSSVAEGRYSLFMCKYMQEIRNSKHISLENLQWFYDTCSEWDKMCNLPLEFGLKLEELTKDDSIVLGIRRIRLQYGERENGIPTSEELDYIMRNGEVNNGHSTAIGGVAMSKLPDPSLAFTPIKKSFGGYINLVCPYHDSNTVLIAAFPSDVVDDSLGIKDKDKASDIYILSDDNPVVRPECLLGAIIKNENGFDEFYTRDEILSSRLSK